MKCETCRYWEPNTVARVMGWCSQQYPPKAVAEMMMSPILFLKLCTPYSEGCGEHKEREA